MKERWMWESGFLDMPWFGFWKRRTQKHENLNTIMFVVDTDKQLDLIRLFYLLKSCKFQAPNIKYQWPKLKIQNILITRNAEPLNLGTLKKKFAKTGKDYYIRARPKVDQSFSNCIAFQ